MGFFHSLNKWFPNKKTPGNGLEMQETLEKEEGNPGDEAGSEPSEDDADADANADVASQPEVKPVIGDVASQPELKPVIGDVASQPEVKPVIDDVASQPEVKYFIRQPEIGEPSTPVSTEGSASSTLTAATLALNRANTCDLKSETAEDPADPSKLRHGHLNRFLRSVKSWKLSLST